MKAQKNPFQRPPQKKKKKKKEAVQGMNEQKIYFFKYFIKLLSFLKNQIKSITDYFPIWVGIIDILMF